MNPGKTIGVKPLSVILPSPPTGWLCTDKVSMQAIMQQKWRAISQGLKEWWQQFPGHRQLCRKKHIFNYLHLRRSDPA
jgi:hypothetical protein